MKDIKIESEKTCFVYRVAAVIIHDNKILLQKTENFDYISFIGGKCQIGETSVEAVLREVIEETGIKCEYVKTRGIIENFFHSEFDGNNRHEIDIFLQLKIIDKKYLNMDIIPNQEDNAYSQHYEWFDLNNIDKINLKPNIAVDVLKSEELFYKIHKEY